MVQSRSIGLISYHGFAQTPGGGARLHRPPHTVSHRRPKASGAGPRRRSGENRMDGSARPAAFRRRRNVSFGRGNSWDESKVPLGWPREATSGKRRHFGVHNVCPEQRQLDDCHPADV